ncbi:hypothetical protein GCM10022408_10080 [Hymenobacter fastidiosus]|uniref:Uncharacterized protein n=1 Tax=Hymenobacter fastidiosus TaxID=486264 RepID=A0ABP7RR25_9BACT
MYTPTPAEQKLMNRLTPDGVYDIQNGNVLVGPIATPEVHAQTLPPDEVEVVDDLKLGNKISRDSIGVARSNANNKIVDGVIGMTEKW